MFITWSVFGFLIKRPYVEKQYSRYKHSIFDDAEPFLRLQPAASPITVQSLWKRSIEEERMGMDERYSSTEPDGNATLHRIAIDLKKKSILEFLQNPTIGIYDKLMVAKQVDERDISHNMTNGGLFQDWDFVL